MCLTEVRRYRRNLERCVGQIQDWCSSKRLQLKSDKTEIIWFGSKANLAKLKADELCSISDLLISGRSLWYEILASAWTANSPCVTVSREWHLLYFFYLRRLRQLHAAVCCSNMQRLVSALLLSRLDYCNAVLSRLPSTTLDLMRRVLNAAIHLVAGRGPRDQTNEEAPLVANQIPYQFQVMSDDARRCDWSISNNTFLTLSILCQHYLNGIDFEQLRVASSTSPR